MHVDVFKPALRYAHRWDPASPLAANLERCLDVKFPARPSDATRDSELLINSCGICYGTPKELRDVILIFLLLLLLEFQGDSDAVPDVVCGNQRCGKCFHRSCLYDWLRSIPTTKQSFATMFGVCPFCDQAIR